MQPTDQEVGGGSGFLDGWGLQGGAPLRPRPLLVLVTCLNRLPPPGGGAHAVEDAVLLVRVADGRLDHTLLTGLKLPGGLVLRDYQQDAVDDCLENFQVRAWGGTALGGRGP